MKTFGVVKQQNKDDEEVGDCADTFWRRVDTLKPETVPTLPVKEYVMLSACRAIVDEDDDVTATVCALDDVSVEFKLVRGADVTVTLNVELATAAIFLLRPSQKMLKILTD